MHPLFSEPWDDHPAAVSLLEPGEAGEAGAELPKILESQLPRSRPVSFQPGFGCSTAELVGAGLTCAAPPLCVALCVVPVCAFALFATATIMMHANTAAARDPLKSGDTCFMAIPL
jgi:hypothetical protein